MVREQTLKKSAKKLTTKASPYSAKKPEASPFQRMPEPAASSGSRKPPMVRGPVRNGQTGGKAIGENVIGGKALGGRLRSRTDAARPGAPIRMPGPGGEPLRERVTLPAPCAMVVRRASEALRRDHLWVYASDVEQVEVRGNDAPGLMPVVDNRGILLGTALYSPASQIALRMVSRELITEAEWLALLASRMRTAIGRRRMLLNDETNACRLVFSEADELPGVIIDKYAGIVVVQLLVKGLDTAQTREVCMRVLREELEKDGERLTIWERPDARIRELEGLSAPAGTACYSSDPALPLASTLFRLNGLSFHFDANSGQKTGAFLDQRENYVAAADWARKLGVKKALDVCTYQGGFALHLAKVCERVTGIDTSRSSLEIAEKNLEENEFPAQVDWVEADAFDILRAWSEVGKKRDVAGGEDLWDLIVLDPPAFAKSKRAVEGALRGYKELNLRALMMLKPGGLLVTCSCSHHVTWTDLEGAVASAAVDAHRRVTLLERRGAAVDHPVVMTLPETEYLKCLICRVD